MSDHETTAPARKKLVRFAPVVVLAVALVAFLSFDVGRYIGLDQLGAHRDWLNAFVQQHFLLAHLIGLLIYAVAVAASIPGAIVLTLASGFLFGLVGGSIVAVTGATIGATAIFLAARTAFGDVLRARAGPWVQKLEDGINENAFSYLLSLRMIPVVPFWLLNLVPAFVGVRVSTFMASTFLGIIPGTVVYVGIGNGLGATLDAGGTPNLGVIFEPQVLLPLLGLAVLSLLPVVVKKLKGRSADRP